MLYYTQGQVDCSKPEGTAVAWFGHYLAEVMLSLEAADESFSQAVATGQVAEANEHAHRFWAIVEPWARPLLTEQIVIPEDLLGAWDQRHPDHGLFQAVLGVVAYYVVRRLWYGIDLNPEHNSATELRAKEGFQRGKFRETNDLISEVHQRLADGWLRRRLPQDPDGRRLTVAQWVTRYVGSLMLRRECSDTCFQSRVVHFRYNLERILSGKRPQPDGPPELLEAARAASREELIQKAINWELGLKGFSAKERQRILSERRVHCATCGKAFAGVYTGDAISRKSRHQCCPDCRSAGLKPTPTGVRYCRVCGKVLVNRRKYQTQCPEHVD